MSFSKSKKLRSIVFALIYFSGLPYLIRNLLQNNKCTIILYHDINAEVFEKHFLALKKRYNIISLQDYLNAKRNGNHIIPKRALIITLDDGHKENYNLLPVVKKFSIPLTIFLCSSIINSNRNYWFKYKDMQSLKEELRNVSAEQMDVILKENGFDWTKEFNIRQSLNREEIENMKSFVDFQSHTKFHLFLQTCTDIRAKNEINGSKEELEKGYGLKINSLSYPNGDFTEREIYIAQQAGFEAGITVDLGFNSLNENPYKLKRICISDDASIYELMVQAAGISKFVKTIFRKPSIGFILKN